MSSSIAHRVLVLCHGNINRSAACAAVLQTECDSSRVEVRSAGLSAEDGHRAAKKTRDFLADLSYRAIEDHRSRQVTPEDLQWATLIIYMDGPNLVRLRTACGFDEAVLARARCLGDWCLPPQKKIADPGFLARDSEQFRDIMRKVVGASVSLASELVLTGALKP